MCAARAELIPTIYRVPGQSLSGETIIICNGIETIPADAISKGQEISQFFGNREVFVFHNPTSLGGYLLANHLPDPEATKEQKILSDALRDLIRDKIRQHQDNPEVNRAAIRIILFAHSHGVQIAFKALHGLHEEREKIHIYSFGGATLIPKNFAKVACNYFLKGDSFAEKANTKDLDQTLERILDIHGRIRRTPEDMPAAEKLVCAIFERTCEELALNEIAFRNAPRGEFEMHPAFPKLKKRIEECFAAYEVIAREPRTIVQGSGLDHAMTVHSIDSYFREYLESVRIRMNQP